MLEACELNFVFKEDYNDLGRLGLGSCLLGGLPDWLVAYATRLGCAFICLDTFFFYFCGCCASIFRNIYSMVKVRFINLNEQNFLKKF